MSVIPVCRDSEASSCMATVTLSFPISIGSLDIGLLLCVYWLDKIVLLVH